MNNTEIILIAMTVLAVIIVTLSNINKRNNK